MNIGKCHGFDVVLSADMRRKFPHTLIGGPTGSGKSKLQEIMALQSDGFTMIDTDGKTARDTYARLTEGGMSPFQKYDTLLLCPAERPFSLDPFPADQTGREGRGRLQSSIDSTARALGRKEGIPNYREQLQRGHILRVLLFLCGTNVNGKHYGLSKAFDFLDVGSHAWDRIYQKIEPELPEAIATDWRRIRRMSMSRRDELFKSTYNILYDFLTEQVLELFSQQAPPLDFRKLVRNRCRILCDLEARPGFSAENNRAVASLLITQLHDACWAEYMDHILFAEEAHTILGEDLGDFMARARKRHLEVVISINTLAGLRDNQTDITDVVLANVGKVILLNQQGNLDVEYWSEFILNACPILDILLRPMDRPDGYDFYLVKEGSRTRGTQITNGTSQAWGNQKTTTKTYSDFSSESEGGGAMASRAKTKSSSESTGTGLSHQGIWNEQYKMMIPYLVPTDHDGSSSGTAFTEVSGETSQRGKAWGGSNSRSSADGSNYSRGVNGSRGATNSQTESVRVMPLSRHKEELYPAGLAIPKEAQLLAIRKTLRTLKIGETVTIIRGLPPAKVKIHHLPHPDTRLVEETKQWTWSKRPEFFIPKERVPCIRESAAKRISRNGTKPSSKG